MIKDPAAAFTNDYIRRFADRLAGILEIAQEMPPFDESLFPDDKAHIDDGALNDGLAPITGADVKAIYAVVQAILEANAEVIKRVAVNAR